MNTCFKKKRLLENSLLEISFICFKKEYIVLRPSLVSYLLKTKQSQFALMFALLFVWREFLWKIGQHCISRTDIRWLNNSIKCPILKKSNVYIKRNKHQLIVWTNCLLVPLSRNEFSFRPFLFPLLCLVQPGEQSWYLSSTASLLAEV